MLFMSTSPKSSTHASGQSPAGTLLLRRCGVTSVSTPLSTLNEDAEDYAAHGFGAMGLFLHKLERERMEEFFLPSLHIAQDVIDGAASAIKASGLATSSIMLAGRYTVSEIRAEMIEHTLHAIDIAAQLEASCLLIVPGPLNGLTQREALDVSARCLTEVLERRRSPVKLAIEPVVGLGFVSTLSQALDLADLVGHPDVGVVPDTHNLRDSTTLMEDIDRAAGRIFGFHLVDYVDDRPERLIPGEGTAPLVDIVRAAEAAGYAGTYDLEHIFEFDLARRQPEKYSPQSILARARSGMSSILAEAGVLPR